MSIKLKRLAASEIKEDGIYEYIKNKKKYKSTQESLTL
jgi:hypothetical protein